MSRALVEFYGLRSPEAVRLRSDVVNLVTVTPEAWAERQRPGRLLEPPQLWVRGQRVYDFHGDRGTVADFESDLLERQVEDDAICRTRRQKQQLLPFPFLPAGRSEVKAFRGVKGHFGLDFGCGWWKRAAKRADSGRNGAFEELHVPFEVSNP